MRVRWLTAWRSLMVHLVYDDGSTVCGHRPDMADEDEGGVACGRCVLIARAQGLTVPSRAALTAPPADTEQP